MQSIIHWNGNSGGRAFLSVIEIEKNDEAGINGVRNYTWKSALPYKLNFNMKLIEKKPLQSLKGIAFGELEGSGEWLFNQKIQLYVCSITGM